MSDTGRSMNIRAYAAASSGSGDFHGARMSNSSTNSPSGYPITLEFVATDYDTDGFVTSSSQMTIPAGMAGRYTIRAHVACAISSSNPSGLQDIDCQIMLGAAQIMTTRFAVDKTMPSPMSAVGEITIALAEGDVISVQAASVRLWTFQAMGFSSLEIEYKGPVA